MPKVTIDDISAHTGLSRGTVSRALNDRPDISHETKQRVLDACRELKYVPSRAARMLATGQTFAVAVVVDDLRSPIAAQYVRGAARQAQENRYAIQVTELGASTDEAVLAVRSALLARVDGALLLASDVHFTAEESGFGAQPVVSSVAIPGMSCDVVVPDYVESGRLVGRALLRVGGGAVLYVHDDTDPSAAERLVGVREVLSSNGVDGEQVIVPPAALDSDRLSAVRAVGATHDRAAVQCLLELLRLGRSPGDDCYVMGQGNELVASATVPALTTVDLNGEEVGERAMDTLLKRIRKSHSGAAERTAIAPRLVTRESLPG